MRSAAVLLSTTRSSPRPVARPAMRAQRRSSRAVKPSPRPCNDRAALLTRRLAGMTRRYVRRRPVPPERLTGFAAARLH
jgi:hypothetical protein